MSTNSMSAKDIKRNWHHVDAKGQILGRIATDIATKLMGKNKPSFVPFLDNGDFVIVTNSALVKVTGRKAKQKVYFRHSGFPGGDKQESFEKLNLRRPNDIIKYAVSGMLPKSKLGKEMVKKLHIYSGEKHPFEKQLGAKV
ncbi:50S ribosomal protein L13 [Candidatus Daviesbacteria bacterium RIFCSPHIGHO2_01_FULL_44_29]|uniref:Large ribosomal subunit protein uL13 n=1 Tax=Candidatus Daviesbacteria bacterium RIFCSPHIGHO2_02_FULL_43_12 TaxID=1797776 RepID=A0A1F5KH38_9BACT|nr:MAG: 50S ribosomal protein L13 [Candidatus Daviesbacteria bacterium RIFCSPHIGHO2_01_FULL_44_29]OGE39931.1 MAG: 50S ribosomal protein L13 [Candidatus Daviesbacteria bacterium RIFCSPHIGHO2_02_FULL_43_12]OGE40511.1 MAG: 50S ribosomal protein L13 [Candidatus Daviesbacteria bacterium RIFCSPHIGHO2_12_FULL_47_45]OGE70388.1 MAG: 50S ribosomal protein L13 [Candidatus Daviesbacteria bacterium RIFCSPLOWO2_01_FULL_43_15]